MTGRVRDWILVNFHCDISLHLFVTSSTLLVDRESVTEVEKHQTAWTMRRTDTLVLGFRGWGFKGLPMLQQRASVKTKRSEGELRIELLEWRRFFYVGRAALKGLRFSFSSNLLENPRQRNKQSEGEITLELLEWRQIVCVNRANFLRILSEWQVTRQAQRSEPVQPLPHRPRRARSTTGKRRLKRRRRRRRR